MSICVVCEYGWIIKGIVRTGQHDNELRLVESSIVRRWDNGKGIGGIAKKENAEEYVLDFIGDVAINRDKILFEIPCEW